MREILFSSRRSDSGIAPPQTDMKKFFSFLIIALREKQQMTTKDIKTAILHVESLISES